MFRSLNMLVAKSTLHHQKQSAITSMLTANRRFYMLNRTCSSLSQRQGLVVLQLKRFAKGGKESNKKDVKKAQEKA